ncbi:Ku protein [Saccharopolyspora shandongensis]|uniref:Ku protein n=1 Tax=Saccharopolyspora shandongensis TaxID=418495 RepID=UPI0033C11390
MIGQNAQFLHISFGLITIPCTLHRATRDRSVGFHQVHTCGGHIRYRKFCERESREVPSTEIASAYEYAGRLGVLTNEGFDNPPLGGDRCPVPAAWPLARRDHHTTRTAQPACDHPKSAIRILLAALCDGRFAADEWRCVCLNEMINKS